MKYSRHIHIGNLIFTIPDGKVCEYAQATGRKYMDFIHELPYGTAPNYYIQFTQQLSQHGVALILLTFQASEAATSWIVVRYKLSALSNCYRHLLMQSLSPSRWVQLGGNCF